MIRVLVLGREDLKLCSNNKNILEIHLNDINIARIREFYEYDMIIYMDGYNKKLLKNRYGNI